VRRTRIRPVSKKRTSRAALVKLARRLVVELRDGNTCQRCGNIGGDCCKIDWAHVKAGRALSLTYAPWAALALCAGCHFFFDGNGNGKPDTLSRRWWAEKFPDRDLLLRQWEQQRSRPKFDPDLTALWLRQEIAKLER
jgi:hypothetical protein